MSGARPDAVIVDAVLTGAVVPFGKLGGTSAIAKYPQVGRQWLGPEGFTADEQADRRVHGGPDKAVHHYPHDHYRWWRHQIGPHPLLDTPGAFGENIATSGLLEADLCIGDRFGLGEAVVEVAQGRQPCWKLNQRFERPDILGAVVASGRAGWYYRVIEPGWVRSGDALALLARPLPAWTVERCIELLVAGGHRTDPAACAELAEVALLAEEWRLRALKLSR